jgi:4a-hydroxytetrahydrobiopterin dehydratase
MDELASMHCSAISSATPRMGDKDIRYYLEQLEDWRLYDRDGEPRLEKEFTFKDFKEALAFSNRVAQAAEAENHHPSILTEWGKVTVTWWTHRIKGLTLNDFIMAAKTEQTFDSSD